MTIVSIFLPGCWIVLEPVPTHYETVVVEEPAITVVAEYPICDYGLDPYPYKDVAYCTDDSCVWEFYYSSYYCEEEWYYSNTCGWELGYRDCYAYEYYN